MEWAELDFEKAKVDAADRRKVSMGAANWSEVISTLLPERQP